MYVPGVESDTPQYRGEGPYRAQDWERRPPARWRISLPGDGAVSSGLRDLLRLKHLPLHLVSHHWPDPPGTIPILTSWLTRGQSDREYRPLMTSKRPPSPETVTTPAYLERQYLTVPNLTLHLEMSSDLVMSVAWPALSVMTVSKSLSASDSMLDTWSQMSWRPSDICDDTLHSYKPDCPQQENNIEQVIYSNTP